MLRLRRGVVRSVAGAGAGGQLLEVELDAGGSAAALATLALVGRCEPGDVVIVNTTARELDLGSTAGDIVHVNLTRGLDAQLAPERVLALNYTSLQHAIAPVEAATAATRLPPRAPVAILALHGQLAPLAWALAQAAPGTRLGYVQTAGGALPAAHLEVAAELARRGLLSSRLAAAPAFGGADGDAITLAGALVHGFAELGWDAAACGPGPGIVGSATALGHGGLAALDALHTVAALGGAPLLVPRLSGSDPRERHRGLSHHTRTVLELALVRPLVALPEGEPRPGAPGDWREAPADLSGYLASGLTAEAMGRADPLFFRAALAGGALLAQLAPAAREP
ncbi:MAG TPA: DUF3866 family protein [Solirubrobacteraceae bacterium]|nr:DUF3866 family protein [Solirubrobacteraceae bacterium]